MSRPITWKIDYDGIEKNFQEIKDFAVFTVEPPMAKMFWTLCQCAQTGLLGSRA